MSILKRLFCRESPGTSGTSFEAFFHDTPPHEQERILREVMQKADEDQRRVVEKYDRLHPKTI